MLSTKRLGRQTVCLQNPPSITASACIVGAKEGEGPLRATFDYISNDSYFGEKSWEKAETVMLKQCFTTACDKAKLPPSDVQYAFSGDLLNQCISSAFALRDTNIPFFGLFGACSTIAEGLSLASMLIDGGFSDNALAMSSSHFCSAERQFRYPLEYGGQRTPTAQWTVTGAGAFVLTAEGPGPYITHVTTGHVVDAGITDANNMGAAMAPAAYEAISAHFSDTGRTPNDYDVIVTGDLGSLGHEILLDLFAAEGIVLGKRSADCGKLIFSAEMQDVHAGGSGCGCGSSVLAGHFLGGMREGRWRRILFVGTGALMSTTSSQQKESIPGICHAVSIDVSKSAG